VAPTGACGEPPEDEDEDEDEDALESLSAASEPPVDELEPPPEELTLSSSPAPATEDELSSLPSSPAPVTVDESSSLSSPPRVGHRSGNGGWARWACARCRPTARDGRPRPRLPASCSCRNRRVGGASTQRPDPGSRSPAHRQHSPCPRGRHDPRADAPQAVVSAGHSRVAVPHPASPASRMRVSIDLLRL
jgi:hypothetical protein